MSLEDRLRRKLDDAFSPEYLNVLNESGRHNVPPGSESHFRVTIVSDRFDEASRIERHRLVHRLLEEELAGPIHALAVEALTPEEWQRKGGVAATSPDCRGGDRRRPPAEPSAPSDGSP
jgi:BolA protein